MGRVSCVEATDLGVWAKNWALLAFAAFLCRGFCAVALVERVPCLRVSCLKCPFCVWHFRCPTFWGGHGFTAHTRQPLTQIIQTFFIEYAPAFNLSNFRALRFLLFAVCMLDRLASTFVKNVSSCVALLRILLHTYVRTPHTVARRD